MYHENFGDMLYDARRRQGLTIEQASRVTRVRARFLDAFERCDFNEMPPAGYAQNMIVSYARFLRIDPEPIIEAFKRDLAEYRASEQGQDSRGSNHSRSRSGISASAGDMSRRTSRTSRYGGRTYSDIGDDPGSPRRAPRGISDSRRSSYARGQRNGRDTDRRMPDDDCEGTIRRSPRLKQDRQRDIESDVPLTIGERIGDLLRRFVDLISRRNGNTETNRQRSRAAQHMNADELADDVIRERGTATYNTYKQHPIDRKTLLFGVGIAAVIIIALAVFLISSCHGDKQAETNAPTPVVGTTDVSASQNQVTTTNGEPFTISFTVAENSVSDMTVIVDGKTAYEGPAAGPVTETYTVSKSVQMTIGSPDVVTVKMGDTETQPTITSDGTGTIDLSVS